MEAKELMIGDCVYSKLHNVDTTVITVEGKDYNSVWLESKECWERHYMKEIEPIPLKITHLKKNGFEVQDIVDNIACEDSIFVYKEGYEIKVIMDEGISELGIPPSTHLFIDFADRHLDMYIDYVHELQHALRLFGIEKEIIID